ncbi:phytanoyl-CoA dioxygenase family protein [Cytophagaceae bacterium DM2B3-1]|uniref:Phytanoyl-CoA dioxygenase family protein n=1 Tax=Xanthocytophaga flava TaxID=3048013 RepID=A0ABT7CMU3_9BACT|nr:phytanoyl-CoA dioxygenase family protein [Xanthocytophaga flavus]MDJ1469789.1 phytanoyl-CoA dioxygenase family protein [Xanthocytophaga flavus]MDJ1494302.1 phytanoyl-CoA dioxygenase family protein [Xanthocytophaga flavus]
MLTDNQIHDFIQYGFVCIENAFSSELATQCRTILWKDTGCDPHDTSTWTKPVVRLGEYSQEPFRQAANTPVLHAAYNQLVGEQRWLPRQSLGSFPVRFPHIQDPGDTGWHVDASFPGADVNDFFAWRVNVFSKGRALLMLFLFSDVTEADAPTRILAGSHLDVAKVLKPKGEEGLSFMELAQQVGPALDRPLHLATGTAGTVYLCHPFLVHASQAHHGTNPKFMAQPPLFPSKPFQLDRDDRTYSPIEQAIRLGISEK